MKKFIISLCMAVLLAGGVAQGQIVIINFDNAGNWTAGSGFPFTTTRSDHTYIESGWFLVGSLQVDLLPKEQQHPKMDSLVHLGRIHGGLTLQL